MSSKLKTVFYKLVRIYFKTKFIVNTNHESFPIELLKQTMNEYLLISRKDKNKINFKISLYHIEILAGE